MKTIGCFLSLSGSGSGSGSGSCSGLRLGSLVLALGLAACGDSTMNTTPMGNMTDDTGGATRCQGPSFTENVTSCMPAASDYRPRVNMSMGDTWPTCVTDNGSFPFIGGSAPASASRTAAFESIAARLWNNSNALTTDDFLKARDDYSVMEGIGSRVARRQDVRYPELAGDKFACADLAVAAKYPNRCFGPAQLKPIIDDAFQKGLMGQSARIQAARLEASLLWFFYLSILSEIWTSSFDDIVDVDASYGYWNGAQPRDMPMGLGKIVRSLGQETYDRGMDAVYSTRCWRDIDKALPYTNTMYFNLAQQQNDKAMTRGMALILRDRFGQLGCSTGAQQQANLEFVRLMGGFLDRAARAIDATKADQLKAQWSAQSAASVNVATAQQLLDQLFPCP